jgi:hypothetical protein
MLIFDLSCIISVRTELERCLNVIDFIFHIIIFEYFIFKLHDLLTLLFPKHFLFILTFFSISSILGTSFNVIIAALHVHFRLLFFSSSSNLIFYSISLGRSSLVAFLKFIPLCLPAQLVVQALLSSYAFHSTSLSHIMKVLQVPQVNLLMLMRRDVQLMGVAR